MLDAVSDTDKDRVRAAVNHVYPGSESTKKSRIHPQRGRPETRHESP